MSSVLSLSGDTPPLGHYANFIAKLANKPPWIKEKRARLTKKHFAGDSRGRLSKSVFPAAINAGVSRAKHAKTFG